LDLAVFGSAINTLAKSGDLNQAELLLESMEKSGLTPDEITYGSLIHACSLPGKLNKKRAKRYLEAMKERGLHPGVFAYSLVIDAFVKSSDLDGADKLFEEMKTNQIKPDRLIFTHLIHACARGLYPDPKRARRYLKHMQQYGINPNVMLLNSVINSHAQCGDVDGAEELVNEMEQQGLVPDKVTFGSMIHACANAKHPNPKRAIQFLRKMKQRNIEPNLVAYNAAVNAHARSGDLDGADMLVKEMGKTMATNPDQVTFSSLINACLDQKDTSSTNRAFRYLTEMTEKWNVEPNIITFNSAFKVLSKSGNLELADHLLKEMESRNIGPDIASYTFLLNTCNAPKARPKPHRARAFLNSMRDEWRQQRQNNNNNKNNNNNNNSALRPNTGHYNTVIGAYCKAGDVAGAELILKDMISDKVMPDVFTFNSLIHACTHTSRPSPKLAFRFFETMQEMQLKPNSVTFNALINAHAKLGQVDGAERALDEMKQNGIQPDSITYGSLVHTCASANPPDVARARKFLDLAKEQKQAGLRTWNAAIDAFAKFGDMQGAEQLLKEMEKEGLEPDIVTFSSLINACGNERGDSTRALRYLELMKERGLKPNAYTFNCMVDALAKSGDLDGAERLLLEMEEQSGLQANVVTFTSLIHACANSHNVAKHRPDAERALKYWEMMVKDRKIKPDIRTFNSLIDVYAKFGDLDRAENLLDEMQTVGIEADVFTFNHLINACANTYKPNPNRAREFLNAMKDRGLEPRVVTYNSAINAYTKAGDLNGAQNLLLEMGEIGLEPDEVTISTLETASREAAAEGIGASSLAAWLARRVHTQVNKAAGGGS